ncbi:MAG: hypothetical protein GY773_00055 [Actinomycetia bacterium]|nr:hypothetical protein [Actinomycetes bacterium]
MAAPQHIYETFIRATPAEVWTAITQPEFTQRYFHKTRFESDLMPGSGHRYVVAGDVDAVDGTIEEVDVERHLVMTWRVLYDTAMAEEPPSRVEWTLRPANSTGTVTRLTVRHFDLGMSPLTSDNVALGWIGILQSLKSLLETGEPLGDLDIEPVASEGGRDEHRRIGAKTNGESWDLLSRDSLNESETDELIERANASAYHWRRATDEGAVERARAAWMLARCHTVAGHTDLALHHAKVCATLTEAASAAGDFDRAYAHEALARANALAGRLDEAAKEKAAAAAEPIADAEDRKIIEADIADGPWFGLD